MQPQSWSTGVKTSPLFDQFVLDSMKLAELYKSEYLRIDQSEVFIEILFLLIFNLELLKFIYNITLFPHMKAFS